MIQTFLYQMRIISSIYSFFNQSNSSLNESSSTSDHNASLHSSRQSDTDDYESRAEDSLHKRMRSQRLICSAQLWDKNMQYFYNQQLPRPSGAFLPNWCHMTIQITCAPLWRHCNDVTMVWRHNFDQNVNGGLALSRLTKLNIFA